MISLLVLTTEPTLKINFLAVLDFFYRIRQFLTDSALKSLYFSFVYSHPQFAIGAWGGVRTTTLNQLNVLHNKIIRAMTYSSFRTKITPLYKKLNLLKLDDIYSLELGKSCTNFTLAIFLTTSITFSPL